MDKQIRKAQKQILDIFSDTQSNFALAGGTALEMFYLHHRFSADLDFFSPQYSLSDINKLIAAFKKGTKRNIKFETEFTASERARVRFYTLPINSSNRFLKMDFVEDVLFKSPGIKTFKGCRVYDVRNIYLQKIYAICGTRSVVDDIGREVSLGRNAARDAFDLFMLSKKITPLHQFLKAQTRNIQRGMVHWYRTFSRQDLKLTLLDLDIYDPEFNAREMIAYLENEIKKFISQVLEG